MKDDSVEKPAINDGGPAFPTLTDFKHRAFAYEMADAHGLPFPVVQQSGMTFRAWLAGQVIIPIIQAQLSVDSDHHVTIDAGSAARNAIAVADALIAELEGKR